LSPNVKLVAYAIMKSLQNELYGCYMTFAYEYKKCFTFMMLISDCLVSVGNYFVVCLLESYIVHFRSNLDVCIWTNIQWLLFMKTCWRQLVRCLFIVPMIVYVCCWYPNDCNFWTYNICIMVVKCWLLNHPFGSRIMFSSFLVNWNYSC